MSEEIETTISNQIETQIETQIESVTTAEPKFFIEKDEKPLFAFDEPQTIKLKNGTVHFFKIPTRAIENRKEQLSESVITTLAAKVNGQNLRNVQTEYNKPMLRYYKDCIESVSGYALNAGDDSNAILQANLILDDTQTPPETVADNIPTRDRIAAASRLYAGKITVDKPEVESGAKTVIVLRNKRFIKVKQEIGVEQNSDGTFTEPTEIINYTFREPNSSHLSKWDTSAFNGNSYALNDGGSRETRTFNLTTIEKLFDDLIVSIDGGGIERDVETNLLKPIDVTNPTHLAKISINMKKNAILLAMNEITTESGN